MSEYKEEDLNVNVLLPADDAVLLLDSDSVLLPRALNRLCNDTKTINSKANGSTTNVLDFDNEEANRCYVYSVNGPPRLRMVEILVRELSKE